MKFLKLGLIFAIFVGAIVLVMNWKSIVHPDDHDTNFAKTDKIDVKQKCNNFRNQWSKAKSWDQKLYDQQISQIKAWKAQNYLSATGHNTVSTTVRVQAINKINNSYKSFLSNNTYSHTNLMAAYEGVKYIKAHEPNSAADFKDTDGIHSLYLKVKNFVGSPHHITPTFNAETGQWSSFIAAQNSILNTAASYRNNKYYSDIKNIPGFQNGLNDTYLKSIISKEKPRFYSSLSSMIARAIDNMTPTQENYDKMRDVYQRFADESPSNSSTVYKALKSMKEKLPTQ